jgi:cytochrome P450
VIIQQTKGHDTTAMSICWVLYMLGLYPEVQRKLRAEIDLVVSDHNLLTNRSATDKLDFDSEHLKQMKYLDCVLKETQRVYPTAPFFGRKVVEDTQIGKRVVLPSDRSN